VPEIIDPGVTGHTLSTMDEAIRMLPQVLALDCRTVRQRFEQRFSGGLHRQRLPSGHLEKFLSRRRCESDSLNAGWRRSVPRAIGWRRNHPTLADEDLRAAELSLPERPPPSFRKCVQVVREPAEWPTRLI